MLTLRPAASPRRHLAWLLWLVLLLPIAQTAASWHLLSHAPSGDSSEADGKQLLHPTHCELCLSAAALIGGAPPVQPPGLPHATARHERPNAAASSVWLAPTAPGYESRAPPVSPH